MKCKKLGNHTISYQSLLLSTTVLNDKLNIHSCRVGIYFFKMQIMLMAIYTNLNKLLRFDIFVMVAYFFLPICSIHLRNITKLVGSKTPSRLLEAMTMTLSSYMVASYVTYGPKVSQHYLAMYLTHFTTSSFLLSNCQFLYCS